MPARFVPRSARPALLVASMVALAGTLGIAAARQVPVPDRATDPLRALQDHYAATKAVREPRAYHFGSQGPGDVFSNHTSHTNRLIPVYVFGTKADLGAVTGKNSRYRDTGRIEALYGRMPEHTHNPEAEYADQADL